MPEQVQTVNPETQLERSIVSAQQERSTPDTTSMVGGGDQATDIAQITQKLNDQEVWFNNLLISDVTPLQHLKVVRVVSVSGVYTVDKDDDLVLVDAHTAPVTITLPAAIDSKDRYIFVKKVDSSANTVTIVPTGSDTIDGATSYVLSIENAAVEFTNNDSDKWYVVATSGVSDLLVFQSKTGNYGVTGNDNVILVTCSSANITITLPAAATIANRKIVIKKMDATSKKVTVVPTGAETIDGVASYILWNQNEAVTVISDHLSQWYVVDKVSMYPKTGSFTVTDPATSGGASLTEADGNYKLIFAQLGVTGSPTFAFGIPTGTTKAGTGFTVSFAGAPGNSGGWNFDYIITR